MDHVIADLKRWLEIYKDDPEGERDEKAILCIEKAIKELNRYYKLNELNKQ